VGLQAQAFAPRPFIYLFKGMYDLSSIPIFFFKKKRYIPNTLAAGAKIPVRSHIGSERPEPGPYKCMLTLTSKTRFRAMRGCQEQTREGDPGGSPGHGWTGRPKADNILLVRWGVTFGIRAEDGSS
jgi:hypothetical protein